MANWFRNILCALLVLFCAWIYVRTNIVRPIPTLTGPSDFYAYFHAGQEIRHGNSPYNDPALFYPPLLAFLMVPFAFVDYATARWIWFALSHLFLIGAAGLLWHRMGGGRIALCCIACVWAFSGAINETLRQGQLSPLLVLCLVIAYTESGVLRGTFSGLCFVLKYFPGIVILPFLLARQWRALTASAAVMFAGVCVPWLLIPAFFTGARGPVSATYWMGTPCMFSWSVPSLVLRLLTPITRGAPFPRDWEFGNVAADLHLDARLRWISATTACAVLTIGILGLVIVCRGRLHGRQVPLAMAGLVSLSLAVAPVSWTHYQLLQYPGIAMLLIIALRGRRWSLAIAAAVSFALAYQLPEKFLNFYHDTHSGWTTASPATLWFWTSVPPFASLAIFALTLLMVRHK